MTERTPTTTAGEASRETHERLEPRGGCPDGSIPAKGMHTHTMPRAGASVLLPALAGTTSHWRLLAPGGRHADGLSTLPLDPSIIFFHSKRQNLRTGFETGALGSSSWR